MALSNDIRLAAQVLTRGGLVAFPTETVYGVGADALNPAAVAKIFELKGRPADHPLIVHLPDPPQVAGGAYRQLLQAWAEEVPEAAIALAGAFWPGPMTLILRRAAHVPDSVTGGLDTVGLRVPAHIIAQQLLQEFARSGDGPRGIAAPSANRFGQVSPTTAEHVRSEFGQALLPASGLVGPELSNGAVGVILDGGLCDIGIESTIIDLSTGRMRLLRPGGITSEQITQVLGSGMGQPASRGALPRAPGSHQQHYAPRAALRLIEIDELASALAEVRGKYPPQDSLAILAPAPLLADAQLPDWVTPLSLGMSLEHQARRLYAALREADEIARQIWAVLPHPGGLGTALRDRLARAAGLGDIFDAP